LLLSTGWFQERIRA